MLCAKMGPVTRLLQSPRCYLCLQHVNSSQQQRKPSIIEDVVGEPPENPGSLKLNRMMSALQSKVRGAKERSTTNSTSSDYPVNWSFDSPRGTSYDGNSAVRRVFETKHVPFPAEIEEQGKSGKVLFNLTPKQQAERIEQLKRMAAESHRRNLEKRLQQQEQVNSAVSEVQEKDSVLSSQAEHNSQSENGEVKVRLTSEQQLAEKLRQLEIRTIEASRRYSDRTGRGYEHVNSAVSEVQETYSDLSSQAENSSQSENGEVKVRLTSEQQLAEKLRQLEIRNIEAPRRYSDKTGRGYEHVNSAVSEVQETYSDLSSQAENNSQSENGEVKVRLTSEQQLAEKLRQLENRTMEARRRYWEKTGRGYEQVSSGTSSEQGEPEENNIEASRRYWEKTGRGQEHINSGTSSEQKESKENNQRSSSVDLNPTETKTSLASNDRIRRTSKPVGWTTHAVGVGPNSRDFDFRTLNSVGFRGANLIGTNIRHSDRSSRLKSPSKTSRQPEVRNREAPKIRINNSFLRQSESISRNLQSSKAALPVEHSCTESFGNSPKLAQETQRNTTESIYPKNQQLPRSPQLLIMRKMKPVIENQRTKTSSKLKSFLVDETPLSVDWRTNLDLSDSAIKSRYNLVSRANSSESSQQETEQSAVRPGMSSKFKPLAGILQKYFSKP